MGFDPSIVSQIGRVLVRVLLSTLSFTSDSVQKTNAHRQITWRIILQPDFTQSHDYKTLTRRAQLVCDTQDSLRDENKYLERVFYKKNYNADFIRWTLYRPTEADATNSNPTPVTTVTIPYMIL